VGVIPRLDLPRTINPPRGWVSNANESQADQAPGHLITALWHAPYRGQRLRQLLGSAAPRSLTLDTFASWQNDTLSLPSLALRDAMMPVLPAPTTATDKEAQAILQAWDGHMTLTAKAPLLLAYMQEDLLTALLGDELGDDIDALRPARMDALLRALGDAEHNWCDDVRTKTEESCADTIATAWKTALQHVVDKHGNASSKWEWQAVNIAPLDNKLWQQVPVIRDWVDLATPVEGGHHTLKHAGHPDYDPHDMFKIDHAAGYRGLYSAGDPDAGRYMIVTGESGNILSPDYGNLVPLWAAGKSLTLAGTLSELENKHSRYLTLLAP
jgi:penicillin amidase